MNIPDSRNSYETSEPHDFPLMRKSHSAQQSLAAEIIRLHAMTIEERVIEALGMSRRFADILPARKDR